MSETRHFPGGVALAWKRRKMAGAGGAVAIATILASVTVAAAAVILFAVFFNSQGTLQTVSSDPRTLNASNPFFDPSIGTNGQACVTCHQPSTGITITVPAIKTAFVLSGGRNPLFRFNDTANNPFIPTSSFFQDPANYSLILNLGVVRIGKTVPPLPSSTLPSGTVTRNFTIVAANNATNQDFAAPNTFPLTTDPQHPGTPTVSVFRRPLVNTNVNFDSAVLWDGRESIEAMPTQVEHAIQTLLLNPSPGTALDQSIANFMTGVFTDQTSTFLAGSLSAAGATGGVGNLLALSQSPTRPCVFDEGGALTQFVEAVASTTCTTVTVGAAPFNLFASWLNLPNNRVNAGRLSVARGEQIFNGQVGKANCRFCHTVPNLGNNALATDAGFRADGTDSPAVMQQVLAAATTAAEARMVQDMIDRIDQLPLYCLRPTSDTSGTSCGSDPTDVVTTDPGHALVSGNIADASNVGAVTPGLNGAFFKPPILRDLAVRAPYFHAGAAPDLQHLVTFYNLRFGLGLTSAQQADLVNFLNAL